MNKIIIPFIEPKLVIKPKIECQYCKKLLSISAIKQHIEYYHK